MNRRDLIAKLGLSALFAPFAVKTVAEGPVKTSSVAIFGKRMDRTSDREIWLIKKRGWNSEQVAWRYEISVKQVEESIARYEAYRNDMMNAELDKSVIDMARRVRKILDPEKDS